MKRIICSFFLLTALPSLEASISFDLQGELLKDASGTAIPVSSLVLLVADTTRNGFSAISDSSSVALNTMLNGGDDLVLARFDLSNSSTAGTLFDFASASLGSGWDAGDPLALVWFPTLTIASSSTTSGDAYGLFSGTALDGSDPWVTPADGATGYKLWYFNSDATTLPASPPGSQVSGSGLASFTVSGGAVPEPSRALLGMMGLGVLALRRRRC